MDHLKLPPELESVVSLYVKTKELFLHAEEQDKLLNSSTAIIKEQKDALDHLMRYMGDFFAENPKGEIYRKENLSKAIGHLYRSAYDSLDTLGISFKLRIGDAVEGRSNEAICAIFPEYYKEYKSDLIQIDDKIIESRKTKDIGHFSLVHLDNYLLFVSKLKKYAESAESKVFALVEFDEKRNKAEGSKFTKDFCSRALLVVFGGVLALALAKIFSK